MPSLPLGVSRLTIAQSPLLWRMIGVLYALFAAVAAGAASLHGVRSAPIVCISAGAFLILSGCILRSSPTVSRGKRDAIVICTVIGPTIVAVALGGLGPTAYGVLVYCGPLVAVWNLERRRIALVLGFASLSSAIPLMVGWSSPAMLVSWLCAVSSMWALAVCCTAVLEAAERQGRDFEDLSRRDPLTALANRRALSEAADRAIAESKRSGEPFSVVVFDLNDFKRINDEVGHDAGDEVLVAVAAILRSCAGPRDTAVRQGGDEFCLLLPNCSYLRAVGVAERVRQRLNSINTPFGFVTAGAGIATYPEEARTFEPLLELADLRLRKHKGAREARSERHPPLLSRATGAPARLVTLPSIGRSDLASWPLLWMATAAVYAVYGLGGIALYLAKPSVVTLPIGYLTLACTMFVASLIAASRPPERHAWQTHAVLAATYLMPALALVSTKSLGAALVPLTVWVGPLVALRAPARPSTIAHWTTATALYATLSLVGLVNSNSAPGMVVAIINVWGLGFCCLMVFETTEALGRAARRLAQRDPLTQLPNRHRLTEAAATSDGEIHAVIALDLDHFKQLNDEAGHSAGDQALQRVARTLERLTGDSGEPLRTGGDEFIILIAGSGQHDTDQLGEEIQREINEIEIAGIRLGTGIGIASKPNDGHELQRLLFVADQRLIKHKANRARYLAMKRAPTPLNPSSRPTSEGVSNRPAAADPNLA